jgi:DNA-binding response OmpR family regulator
MGSATRILLIDAEEGERVMLAQQLRLHEYEVVEAATAGDGIKLALDRRPDVVLLEVDLPDIDGRGVCRIMRKRGFLAPLLIVTEQSSDSDTILGLESGANDYIVKPIRFAVLLARMQNHLKLHAQTFSAAFRVGPYEFRPSAKMLIDRDQRRIRLTVKETDILTYLIRADGRLVRREELLTEVWGYNARVNTHTVETHMYRLRQKMEPNPRASRFLHSEEGGYCLKA